MKRISGLLVGLVLVCTGMVVSITPIQAGTWTVTNLGGGEPYMDGCSGGQVYGCSYDYSTDGWYASVWSGSGYVNLNPSGSMSSLVTGCANGQQAGYGDINGYTHALTWSGTADSVVDLNPAGMWSSQALGISNGYQVGYTYDGTSQSSRAALWSGSANSYVDLNPSWSLGSVAYGVYGGVQGGYATYSDGTGHAGIWSGTADSFVDLNPAGASSSCIQQMYDGVQTGYAIIDGQEHIGMWHGTADSWVDLTPEGAYETYIKGYSDGQLVGYTATDTFHGLMWNSNGDVTDLTPAGYAGSAIFGASDDIQAGCASTTFWEPGACIWYGSANSYLDLDQYLDQDLYWYSYAKGVSVMDGKIQVIGYGYNSVTGMNEALMWELDNTGGSAPVPEPGTIVALCSLAAPIGFKFLRRRA